MTSSDVHHPFEASRHLRELVIVRLDWKRMGGQAQLKINGLRPKSSEPNSASPDCFLLTPCQIRSHSHRHGGTDRRKASPSPSPSDSDSGARVSADEEASCMC
jgi:hypothetical protein